jgi:hypothetical protein
MKKYFLHVGNEQQGPFDLDELRTKGITKKTQIWYDGLPDWIDAENCDELKELLKSSTPPPFKKDVNAKQIKKTSNTWNIIRFSIIGVVVLIFLIAWLKNIKDNSYYEKVMTVEELEFANPANFLTVEGKYSENFWGDKINLNCVFTNTATIASYKDITLRITYYTKTKTSLGTKDYIIYEVFNPKSKKPINLKIENFKNVNSVDIDIIKALPYK